MNMIESRAGALALVFVDQQTAPLLLLSKSGHASPVDAQDLGKLVFIERPHVDDMPGTFNDHLVNTDAARFLIETMVVCDALTVIFKRRILIRNYTHAPA